MDLERQGGPRNGNLDEHFSGATAWESSPIEKIPVVGSNSPPLEANWRLAPIA